MKIYIDFIFNVEKKKIGLICKYKYFKQQQHYVFWKFNFIYRITTPKANKRNTVME